MKPSNIVNALIIILVFGGIVLVARPAPASLGSDSREEGGQVVSSGTLEVLGEKYYDFGTISMREGDVRYNFTVKNSGSESVTVNKVYTSCMCTTASLILGEKRFGPYGMPGHGFVPKVDQIVNPGEEATVEAVFDPAAHGPAGVGRIARTITLENNAGAPVELNFSAMVTP
ncbi:MAG: DUF1573 domain-containing protein [Patescibacteria group bacterium]